MAEKEYIDRGALIRHLNDEVKDCGDACENFNPIAYGTILGLKGAISFANTLPAADVVEAVHARWEKIHDDPRVNKYRCTNCKAEKMCDNYCPNCGAKMNGATDNNVGDKGVERKE